MASLSDDNEGEGDDTSESENNNWNLVQPDPPANPHTPRRPRGIQGPLVLHRPMAMKLPTTNLHVKCPIFSAKPEKDANRHISHNNDFMNSQGIVEEEKCARFCLTLAEDSCLWYESITPVHTDWNQLQRLFPRKFSKLGQTQEELFQK